MFYGHMCLCNRINIPELKTVARVDDSMHQLMHRVVHACNSFQVWNVYSVVYAHMYINCFKTSLSVVGEDSNFESFVYRG